MAQGGHTLWYRKPAEHWMAALPVGNGRMGAMVFGRTDVERIGLDEESVWSGSRIDGNHHDAHNHLADIREHLFNKRYSQAKAVVEKHFLGKPEGYGTHLPAGNLLLDVGHDQNRISDYRRQLNLGNAAAEVTYVHEGIRFKREAWATHVDGVVAIRITADRAGSIDIALRFDSDHENLQQKTTGVGLCLLNGQCPDQGVAYCLGVKALPEGGAVAETPEGLRVCGADALVLLVDIQTSFRNADPALACQAQLEAAALQAYDALYEKHVKDHQKLYQRVDLDLAGDDLSRTPTDERLAAYQNGRADPGLEALFFHYGRYLLIASSREDSLPAHLQGVWNDNKAARMCWTCDYHLDINTQQNYWHAEVCRLPECHEAAFRFIESLVAPGRETAKHYYDAPGWVVHVFTNLWGFTAPGWSERWGLVPAGGLWQALHLADHVAFTGDTAFLRTRAYPLLKAAAAFFMAFMVKDPETGYLVTCPSSSPENVYRTSEGEAVSVCAGPTCDRILVAELLDFCIGAAQTLKVDGDLVDTWKEARNQLAPYQIGRHGQIQEWLIDFEEAEPEHRHITHLLGLFPFAQITPTAEPELSRAARRVLERKMALPDWETTEWGLAWNICLFARLLDAQAAHENLRTLLNLTEDNLMTFSPPHGGATENIFVMDGNTAGTAGMAECLLQSHSDRLALLPALPAKWPEGHVRGWQARGAWIVDITWKTGRLTDVRIESLNGGDVTVVWENLKTRLSLKAGQSVRLDGNLEIDGGV